MKAALTIALVCGACATPPIASPSPTLIADSPTPSTSASAAPAAETAFTSSRYGYRLSYPAGWKMSETAGSGGVHPDEPGVDTLTDRAGHILSIVGEPAVPALSAWTCAIGQHLKGEHKLVAEQVEALVVAGAPARLSNYHLVIKPYVIHYLTVEVVRGGRGLTLSLESTTGRDDEDRALLESLLGRLSFTG